MPRTPLAQQLVKVCSMAAESHRRGTEVEEVLESRQDRRVDRREFLSRLVTTGALLGGLGALPGRGRAAPSRHGPRIAVVGAGLAGLTCAYRLRQAGYVATVYEANVRTGG